MSNFDSFVAYFDVLGMTALIRSDIEKAWRELNRLWSEHRTGRTYSVAVRSQNLKISGRVKSFTFSDSVLLYTDYDDDDDAWAICMLGGQLFYDAFNAGIPLRGGIAHGEFRSSSERSIFTGPALLDAYQLGEGAEWVGPGDLDLVALKGRPLCDGTCMRAMSTRQVSRSDHAPTGSGRDNPVDRRRGHDPV